MSDENPKNKLVRDEPYWHQDKEKDLIRQKQLEEEGWNFIRFNKIPERLKLW